MLEGIAEFYAGVHDTNKQNIKCKVWSLLLRLERRYVYMARKFTLHPMYVESYNNNDAI
jgi:hypothetical protein